MHNQNIGEGDNHLHFQMTLPTILTNEELKQITCASRPTTQAHRLAQMGFNVIQRPDNTPLVSRANFLKVTGGLTNEDVLPDIEPDLGAI